MHSSREKPALAPAESLDAAIAALAAMPIEAVRRRWQSVHGSDAPAGFTKDLLVRALAYHLQEKVRGGLNAKAGRILRGLGSGSNEAARHIRVGSIIVREYRGVLHEVMVVPGGFCWQGRTFDSLSTIAKTITGTSWNGPRFFGLRGRGATHAKAETPGSIRSRSLPSSAAGAIS